MTDYTGKYSKEDILAGRGSLFLSYIGFLFIIPIFTKKNSGYAKFHIRQGICLFCFELVLVILEIIFKGILILFLPVPIMVVLNFFLAVLWILALSLGVKGIMNINSGLATQLPLIGKFGFLK